MGDYLIHYGVKGMKWGVRKDYRSTSIRSAIARRQNAKIDKSFKKWETGASNRDTAIDLGKKKNQSQIAYETDRKNKEKKAQYKADNKAYKKALNKNTTYRKGTVRQEVGKDLSRKYMSEAKRAQKAGDQKSYSKMMNRHDIERAKARKAQAVGSRRSSYKAGIKRSMTIAVKTAITGAAIAGGVKYAQSKGYNISMAQVVNAENILKQGRKFVSYMY